MQSKGLRLLGNPAVMKLPRQIDGFRIPTLRRVCFYAQPICPIKSSETSAIHRDCDGPTQEVILSKIS